MNKKKIILFDIDYTLINTDLLKLKIESDLLKATGLPKNILRNLHNKYVNRLKSTLDYNPVKFVSLLTKETSLKKNAVYKVYFNNPTLYKSCIYKDTVPLLRSLTSTCTLGIFSEGNKKFQQTKLALSGLVRYFVPEYVFIFRRKTSPKSLLKNPSGSIIVDDNVNVIKNTEEHRKDIKTFWVNNNQSDLATIKRLLAQL